MNKEYDVKKWAIILEILLDLDFENLSQKTFPNEIKKLVSRVYDAGYAYRPNRADIVNVD